MGSETEIHACRRRRGEGIALAIAVALVAAACGALRKGGGSPEAGSDALAFAIPEGGVVNHFLRTGEVAAHLVVRGGEAPRVLFAFPAGNTGAALWFDGGEGGASVRLDSQLEAVAREDGMRGASGTFEIAAREVTIEHAFLGTVRALRLFVERPDGSQLEVSELPADMDAELTRGPPLVWARNSLGGERLYEMRLTPLDGARAGARDGAVTLQAADGAEVIRFELAAATDEPPLTPIPIGELLNERAASDERLRHALAFLSYDEKLLAGSWRYLTYFGRDTLLGVRLLMPVLQPRAVEAGLGAVIERLGPDGDVAHEEDIAEQAALRHLRRSRPPADLTEPVYDYKMIDDDLMLAPVLAAYLRERGERAGAFLSRKTSAGRGFADAVATNLAAVVARARPFAKSGEARDLIGIDGLEDVGQWRDSQEGLGGGVYPYDVNAVLMPAALRAAAQLYEMPQLGPDPAAAAEARRLSRAWQRARELYRVELAGDDAKARVRAYADELGIPADAASNALDDRVGFYALALDVGGEPIPIMHTDEGFELLFGKPSADELRGIAGRITKPFPAGLRTPVGIVVANPVYSDSRELREAFSAGHYHGTTVWSWKQALLVAGLRRQLTRDDLPDAVAETLARAESALWDVIDATREMRTSELWTWDYNASDGWHVLPFGQGDDHQTESNAAQLLSTVYLALRPPDATPGAR